MKHLGSVAAAVALALGAGTAEAHLMAARQGTVNVVGAEVFTVLSVPASALRDADDDGDGVLDLGELERHQATLKAEIDRRLRILDGETEARTVRLDLMLSPEHGAPGDRADHIVALKHAELEAPPSELRVRCDLFGASAADREITITATRHPASGPDRARGVGPLAAPPWKETETEVGVLTPDRQELAFFPPPPWTPPRPVVGGLSGLLVAGAVLVLAKAIRGRAGEPVAPSPRA